MKNFDVLKFNCTLISICLLVQGWTVTSALFLSSNQPKNCTTPSGAKGYCTLIEHCTHPDLTANYHNKFESVCIIERPRAFYIPFFLIEIKTKKRVGVCCPDDIVERKSSELEDLAGGREPEPHSQESDGSKENVLAPENRECGLATKHYSKILGSRPVKPNQWPWMATIIRPGDPDSYCAGALITDQHVLTAAHCLHQVNVEDVYIRFGAIDFSKSNETRARDFPVLWIRRHIDYNPSTNQNDIAVVKLDRPTQPNTNIWPICMPPLGEIWEGRTGIASGWGKTFREPLHSIVLMKVAVPIWTQETCQHAYYHYTIDDSVFCAGPEGARESCLDSDGSLIVQLPNKRWIVVGIVSWGLRCGNKNRPQVYTRVDRYLSWIMESLKL